MADTEPISLDDCCDCCNKFDRCPEARCCLPDSIVVSVSGSNCSVFNGDYFFRWGAFGYEQYDGIGTATDPCDDNTIETGGFGGFCFDGCCDYDVDEFGEIDCDTAEPIVPVSVCTDPEPVRVCCALQICSTFADFTMCEPDAPAIRGIHVNFQAYGKGGSADPDAFLVFMREIGFTWWFDENGNSICNFSESTGSDTTCHAGPTTTRTAGGKCRQGFNVTQTIDFTYMGCFFTFFSTCPDTTTCFGGSDWSMTVTITGHDE
jgi:hypothetical protein